MAIPTDVQDALDRLSGGYNNGDYNAGTNPLGFSNGGHRINLYALTADMTLVGAWANDQVALISGITADIEAVAAIAADITTVADTLADVSIVAGIAANVSTVAGDSSEINALAAITTAISQVAAIVSAITTVAARDAAIGTVAARDVAIGTVAARDVAIGVVAARDADIGTVAGIASAVSAVAADAVDIGIVATNIVDVGVAADNMVAIQGASGNAAAAITARNEAEGFAEAGKHLTLYWAYSTAVADSNPGAGVFRLNNIALGAATQMFISVTEAEGGDATTWLDSWDDSTTTTDRGTITLVSASDPSTWAKYRVVGANASATGYRKISITHIASAGSLGPDEAFGFAFMATGNRGADGLGTGTVVDNGPATEGNFAIYADGTGVSIEDSGKGPSDFVDKANNGSDFADAHSTLDNLTKLGVNIASAANLNLDAASGVALTITGTTATSTVTLGSGKWRLVRAAGAWPLTVGANLALNNGGANYVCAAGDKILFVSEGATVRGIVFPVSGKMPNTGDVVGPAGSVADEIMVSDGVTGKRLKGSGKSVADFMDANAQLATFYSTLALEQAEDRASGPVLSGTEGNGVFDGFNVLTFVDVAGASNLDTGTAGQLKPSSTLTTVGNTATPAAGNVNFGGVTLADRSYSLTNSTTVAEIKLYSSTPVVSTLKIVKRNSSTNYDVVYSQAFSHPGGGWATMTLSAPFAVPASGTYHVALYYAASQTIETFSASASRASFGAGNAAGAGLAVTETTGSVFATNVTLVTGVNALSVSSSGFTVASSPDWGRLLAFVWMPVGGLVGTDILFDISRNGGANWQAVAMTQAYLRSDGSLVLDSGVVAFSSAAGTSVKWRIRTANSKRPAIYAVGIMAGLN